MPRHIARASLCLHCQTTWCPSMCPPNPMRSASHLLRLTPLAANASSPPSFPHGRHLPLTAKFLPLVATQSLRPKTRESPTLVGRRYKHMPPRNAPRSLHVAHGPSQVGPRLWTTALIGKGCTVYRFIQVPFCKFFLSPFALDRHLSILLWSLYHRTSPHLPHPRLLRARCRAPYYYTIQ